MLALGHSAPGVRSAGAAAPEPRAEVRTDIAGFVGLAARGPLFTPQTLPAWSAMVERFGGHLADAYLAYAVEGFFANGGDRCWVVRVADDQRAQTASLELVDVADRPVLRLTASSPGTWAHRLRVTVWPAGRGRFSLGLRLEGGAEEWWRDLSFDTASPRYVGRLLAVGEGDRLAVAEVLKAGGGDTELRAVPPPGIALAGGDDGLAQLDADHFRRGLTALETVPEVALVAMPDMHPVPHRLPPPEPPPPTVDCRVVPPLSAKREPLPPATSPPEQVSPVAVIPPRDIAELQRQLVGHCERLNRFAVLDVPLAQTAEPAAVRHWWQRQTRRLADLEPSAAAHGQWLLVPDPLVGGALRPVPPSGHVAGIYARVDRTIGVHAPPANERFVGVADVLPAVDDIEHGRFNDDGINAVRALPGRGLRLMGARTLSRDPRWRYVNVRRLLLWIAATLEVRGHGLVFERNGPELWRQVERLASAVLDRLWRRGQLDGASAEQAYGVRCDASTNPPEEIERGRLLCQLGVQPPWPAEFVELRLGRTTGGFELLAEAGADHGR